MKQKGAVISKPPKCSKPRPIPLVSGPRKSHSRINPFEEECPQVQSGQPGWTKSLNQAKNDAHADDLDEEEVLQALWTGSEGTRVWALGVLQERPELATPRAVLESVQQPDEMFDQYHALLLAKAFISLPTTRAWTKERIRKAARLRQRPGRSGMTSPVCF